MKNHLITAVLFFTSATFTLASPFEALHTTNKRKRELPSNNEISSNFVTECTNDDCWLLYNETISKLNNFTNRCQDMFSYTCANLETVDTPNDDTEYLLDTFSRMESYLIEILKSKLKENEIKSLAVEKQLFQQCLKLGTEEEDVYGKEETVSEFKYTLVEISDHTLRNDSWQSLDQKLNALGFGHAFFEIKVDRDPEDYRRKIITVQPPSYSQIKLVSEIVTTALNSITNESQNDEIGFGEYFKGIKETHNDVLQKFFQTLRDYLDNLLEERHVSKHVKHQQEKMSIKKWDKLANDQDYSSTSKVDWREVINRELQKVNLEVDDNEIILVKNKQYFYKLLPLLRGTPNDVIALAVVTKMIAEQLPFVDWKQSQNLKPMKKSLFCFGNTKLYGASFKLLRALKVKELTDGAYYDTIESALLYITDTMDTEIRRTHSLSENQKSYLKSQLQFITLDALKVTRNRDIVSDYYNGLEITSSYYTSIIEYRKFLRNKELSSLRNVMEYSPTESNLFSVVELENPRNRFILNLFLSKNTLVKASMPREVIYGTYGVKVASYLFSLLNENRFEDVICADYTDKLSCPTYSYGAMMCYNPDVEKQHSYKFTSNMLTELFGLRIAYKAMAQAYYRAGYYRPDSITLPNNTVLTMDALFYLVYLRNNCHLGNSLINTISSKSDELSDAFKCYERMNDVSYCGLQAFQIQDKNIFLY